jgi:hypothetical protein
MKPWLRTTISVVLLGLTALGLVNVYSNNDAVVQAASKLVCEDCEAHLVQMGRSPVAQTFSFQVGSTRQVAVVECQRALIFVGEYQCEAKK